MDEAVLEERLNNMNANVKESFDRVHLRHDVLSIRTNKVETFIDGMLSMHTITTIITIAVGGIIAFGIYLNAHVVAVEKENIAHVAKAAGYIEIIKKNEIQIDNNQDAITAIAIIQTRIIKKGNINDK